MVSQAVSSVGPAMSYVLTSAPFLQGLTASTVVNAIERTASMNIHPGIVAPAVFAISYLALQSEPLTASAAACTAVAFQILPVASSINAAIIGLGRLAGIIPPSPEPPQMTSRLSIPLSDEPSAKELHDAIEDLKSEIILKNGADKANRETRELFEKNVRADLTKIAEKLSAMDERALKIENEIARLKSTSDASANAQENGVSELKENLATAVAHLNQLIDVVNLQEADIAALKAAQAPRRSSRKKSHVATWN
jgi:hypothetical protein